VFLDCFIRTFWSESVLYIKEIAASVYMLDGLILFIFMHSCWHPILIDQQAITVLSDMDQSPSMSILESMQPFLKAIVKPELLKHQDKDVKLLVASCLCEITRITAPEAPYSDDILKVCYTWSEVNDGNKAFFGLWQTWWLDLIHSIFILLPLQDIFRLIVGTFSGLNAINGPSFGRRVVILETLARYRSCVVMLDLECDDLVNELFRTFLNVVRYASLVIHLINYVDCC